MIEVDGILIKAQTYTLSHKPSKSTEMGIEFFIGKQEYKIYYFFYDNLVKIQDKINIPAVDRTKFPQEIDEEKDFYVYASLIYEDEGINGYDLDSIGNSSFIEFEKFGKREVKFTTDLYFHKTFEFDPIFGTPTPGIDRFHLRSVSTIESPRQLIR